MVLCREEFVEPYMERGSILAYKASRLQNRFIAGICIVEALKRKTISRQTEVDLIGFV